MSTESKKQGRGADVMSKIILYSVLAFVLILCYVAYLITTNAANLFWERELYRDGPWGSPSVWVSEEGDLWIISEALEEAESCTVYVYMKTADGWDRVSVDPNKSTRTVTVGIYETEPIYEGLPDQIIVDDSELFTCAADVKNGTLVLSEFVEMGLREFVAGRESITLTRYAYEEKIDEAEKQGIIADLKGLGLEQ